MNKRIVLALSAAGLAGLAHAQEVGRVISSTPVIQQVAVPRQVCSNQPVVVQQQPSGAGAAMGAIAGGALGNQIGSGGGRALATMIGLVGGAVVGNNIEGSGGSEVQNVTQCGTQTTYENRAVSYNVVYEYAGRQYQVNLPQDPGPSVQLQVTPVGAANVPPPVATAPAPVYQAAPAPIYQAPVVVAPPVQTYMTAPTVVYPAYYPRPYYRPYYPPVSLSIGYVHHGGHRHGHGHRHYR